MLSQRPIGAPDRGFTLVEVLVAIVLVGVLAAVAVVGVGRLTSQGTGAACSASADAARAAAGTHLVATGSQAATFTELVGSGALVAPAGATVAATTLSTRDWTLGILPGVGGGPPTFSCADAGTYQAAVLASGPAEYVRFDRTVDGQVPVAAGAAGAFPATDAQVGRAGPFVNDPGTGLSGASYPFAAPPSALIPGTGFTVEFWMNAANYSTVALSLVGSSFTLYSRSDMFGFTGASDVWGTDPLPANTWAHVVAFYPNGPRANARLFVNGVERTLSQRLGTSPTTFPTMRPSSSFGGLFPGFEINGRLAELAFYPASVDPATVASHAQVTDAAAYRTAVMNLGPSVYLRFDHTTGGQVVPVVGALGGFPATSTQVGKAGPFAGGPNVGLTGTNYGFAAPPTVTSPGTAFSVEFWMYPTAYDTSPLAFAPPGGGGAILWNRNDSFGFNTGNGDLWGTDPVPLNAWTHVVAVFPNGSRANARLFVNGAERTLTQRAGTTSTTYPNAKLTASLGGWRTGYQFAGTLAELAIYPGTVDPVTIAAHATLTTA